MSDLNLSQRIIVLCDALDESGLEYALGGAIALAFCVGEPRTTRDIDVNVFVSPDAAKTVLDALPHTVERNERDLESLLTEGQQRLNWQGTPLQFTLLPRLANSRLLSGHSRAARWVARPWS